MKDSLIETVEKVGNSIIGNLAKSELLKKRESVAIINLDIELINMEKSTKYSLRRKFLEMIQKQERNNFVGY